MYSEIPCRIDTHGHFKTWTYTKPNEESAMQLLVREAKKVGIGRIFDMPNYDNPVTKRPITREADIRARLNFVMDQDVLQNYSIYVAATPDKEQLEEAAKMVLSNEYPGTRVPGIKAFMGTSVGTLGITDNDKQQIVYATLADNGYNGVIALHCEDDSKFDSKLWNKDEPKTHCFARPLEAEWSSIKDQIEHALAVDFEGTLLVCHTTSGQSIELLKEAQNDYGLKVAAEISPHHALFNLDDMGPLGTAGKMNPPLRTKTVQEGLLEYAKHETKIPVMIGSDNAQHPFMEKIRGPYPSGMGMEVYRTLYPELLKEINFDSSVPARRVDDLTYYNIVDLFGKKKCRV